jgi:Lar family restriction alleviation protein
MNDDLKPCPFCGSTDLEQFDNDWGWPVVSCNKCKASGPIPQDATASDDMLRSVAVVLWNTRAREDAQP